MKPPRDETDDFWFWLIGFLLIACLVGIHCFRASECAKRVCPEGSEPEVTYYDGCMCVTRGQ